MAFSNLSLNGFAPSWGEFNARINGVEIQVLSLNWSEAIEEAIGYIAGNVPGRRSRGRYEPGECTFGIYVSDVVPLEEALIAVAGANASAAAPRLSDAVFPILGQFETGPLAPAAIKMSFENCRIVTRGVDVQEGPDLVLATYSFKPFRIAVNGHYL